MLWNWTACSEHFLWHCVTIRQHCRLSLPPLSPSPLKNSKTLHCSLHCFPEIATPWNQFPFDFQPIEINVIQKGGGRKINRTSRSRLGQQHNNIALFFLCVTQLLSKPVVRLTYSSKYAEQLREWLAVLKLDRDIDGELKIIRAIGHSTIGKLNMADRCNHDLPSLAQRNVFTLTTL